MQKKKDNQQGTKQIKKDTSETTCVDTFYNHKNNQFINWFIGYLEGSENFLIINEHNLKFELNTLLNNKLILLYIKKNLRLGKIHMEIFLDTKIFVYEIINEDELIILTNLLNGKWRSKEKLNTFQLWWKKLERRLKRSKKNKLLKPIFNLNLLNINLNNSWLLGFLENRAIFIKKYFKLTKKTKEIKLNIYIIIWSIHPEILMYIIELLKIKNEIKYKYKGLNVYKIIIKEINNMEPLINYINLYKFKTKQKEIFKKWEVKYLLKKKQEI